MGAGNIQLSMREEWVFKINAANTPWLTLDSFMVIAKASQTRNCSRLNWNGTSVGTIGLQDINKFFPSYFPFRMVASTTLLSNFVSNVLLLAVCCYKDAVDWYFATLWPPILLLIEDYVDPGKSIELKNSGAYLTISSWLVAQSIDLYFLNSLTILFWNYLIQIRVLGS